jgi:hypothetical protein
MTDPVRIGLLSAYRRLMQPLVRILIRYGVSYHELAELLKNVFVEVAERDFRLQGRNSSQSRVAILIGLSRKEVARQKSILETGGQVEAVSNLNRVTRVLVGWHSDPDYTGPYGMPIELPFSSDAGPSFTALVERHSSDMGARALLDELIRVRVVEQTSAGTFKVLMRAYIPENLNADGLERFGEVVHNFIRTYEVNMEKEAPGAGRFERIVFADDGLRVTLMPAFDKLVRSKGQQLLVELDNWLSAQGPSASAKVEHPPRVKTGVGIYHFTEEDQDDDVR